MKLATILFILTTGYATFSAAQSSSSSEGIMTIQPITSIIPPSLPSTPPPLTEPTRTSTRIGGSQIQPTSFTTSPPPSSSASPTVSGSVTTTTIIPVGTPPSVSSMTSVVVSATPTASPNAAIRPLVGISAGAVGVLAALGGAILV
ncbi:hypothetical protein FRC07_012183 [Ceratobasidium sp. 392]|nr:hypothetical protein FRC07_012183 [Ceratobasidium sp. 392]